MPTMIGMMLAHPEFDPKLLDSRDIMTYGASPMPQALLAHLLDQDVLIIGIAMSHACR